MNKSKILGVLMVVAAIILMVLIAGYAVLFSIFGIASGGSFLMITPLLLIATILIIALSFLVRAGIEKTKHKE